MIDGWHGYGRCTDCGAAENAPCTALFTHGSMIAGKTPLATPHGGRPHVTDRPMGADMSGRQFFLQSTPEARTAHALEQPPAPGPMWSNGLAEQQHATEYSSAMLASARRILARLRAEFGDRWQIDMLSYVTYGVSSEGLLPTQLAMLAVIDEEWTSAQ